MLIDKYKKAVIISKVISMMNGHAPLLLNYVENFPINKSENNLLVRLYLKKD